MNVFAPLIAEQINISQYKIQKTINLLNEGATIPFISRYRKEVTGGLDEVQIKSIEDEYKRLETLSKRKETILNSLVKLEKLTPELEDKINSTWDEIILEDIYLPYKPKRRTRAEKARELGLEPLADILWQQKNTTIYAEASKFKTDTIESVDEILAGARDIIAERVSEDQRARQLVRNAYDRNTWVKTQVIKDKEEEGAKYKNYFDFNQPLKRCSSHQILAILRAQKEEVLRMSIASDDEYIVESLIRQVVFTKNESAKEVEKAVVDGYSRLLKPSIETEVINKAKDRADDEAIRVFTENLKQLLLAPPLGQKRKLGIDPGYRTGCKVVCLDNQGNLLHNETIYPHPPQSKQKQAAATLRKLVEAYRIEAIAIGNGTASRETESFVTHQSFDRKVQVFTVSEQGASIYSASSIAREEFPDYDVTVRGAVSIARRLMDP